jgi:hypothetical protein
MPCFTVRQSALPHCTAWFNGTCVLPAMLCHAAARQKLCVCAPVPPPHPLSLEAPPGYSPAASTGHLNRLPCPHHLSGGCLSRHSYARHLVSAATQQQHSSNTAATQQQHSSNTAATCSIMPVCPIAGLGCLLLGQALLHDGVATMQSKLDHLAAFCIKATEYNPV